MPLLRLLGFATLECGCLVGRYGEMAVDREVDYVEAKSSACNRHDHQRNYTLSGSTPQARAADQRVPPMPLDEPAP